MSTNKPEPPAAGPVSPGKPVSPSQHADRLAAALRDNLKRRKAQARARRTPHSGSKDG